MLKLIDTKMQKSIKRKYESESGVVLIVVLIVIAILTVLVVDMIYYTQIDREISANTKDELKARYIAKSGVHVAAGTMKNQTLEELTDITRSTGSDNAEGNWSISVPYFPVGDGSVAVTVVDERSKINLNALVSDKTNQVDQQVLTELTELFRLLGVDSTKSDRFLASLTNWLDSNIEGTNNDQNSGGANSSFYSGLENPYFIKDGRLDSVEEIRMIDGMDIEFFQKIKDYVTVYPGDKKINFSTAPKVVLMAAVMASAVSAIEGQGVPSSINISDDIAEQVADEIIEGREEEPIVGQKRARDLTGEVDPTLEISAGLVGVVHNSGKSDIFSVLSVGSLGEDNPTKRVVEAVLKKTTGNNTETVDIVSWKEL